MKKRILSFLMALALVVCMLPLSLVSAETTAEPTDTGANQETNNETTPDQGATDETTPAAPEGHTIADKHAAGMVFEPWESTDSLPSSGNWYLTDNVTVSGTVDLSTPLNLDMNGKTITSAGQRVFNIYLGTLNLYDGMSEFDAEGNWVSTGESQATITGYSTNDAGCITIYTGGTFNLYSGKFSGNSGNNGAVVYMYSTHKDRTNTGAIFNMYGGEITGNTGTTYGIISAMDPADVKEGCQPGKLNIYGGKITGNTGSTEGTIRLAGDTDVTISGGEICNNTSTAAGTIFATGTTVINMTGGKISGNSAKVGGAFYLNGSAQLNVSNAEICENTVTSTGGAIYMDGSAKLVANNTKVNGNQANYGGAIIMKATTNTLSFTGGQLNNNKIILSGEWAGGAVLFTDKTNTSTFTNVEMKGNSAPSASGGAIQLNSSSTITLIGCTITENTSGNVGSAIYARGDGKPTLILKDTVITGNKATGTEGAVYVKSLGQLYLSGGTIIADNINKSDNKTIASDLRFTSRSGRSGFIQVDELGNGAKVNVYSDDTAAVAATTLVKIRSGKTQTNWTCGWITYRYKNGATAGQTVAYRDMDGDGKKEFAYGHWHGDQEYIPIATKEDLLATEEGKYYYLAKELSIGDTDESTSLSIAWTPVNNVTLCFNGNVFKATSTNAIRTKDTAITLTLQDCNGFYLENGEYVGGGITNTNSGQASGRALYLNDTACTVNWEGGKIFNCVTTASNAQTGGTAIYMRTGTINFSNGAICNNTNKDNGSNAVPKLGIIQMNSGTLNITGGSFYGNQCISSNTADAHGGVIRQAGGTVVIKNAKFFDNRADSKGGALYLINGTTITGTEFRNNTATVGGAIMLEAGQQTSGKAATNVVFTMNNCLFEGNEAVNGGAIAVNLKEHADTDKTNTLTLNIQQGTRFVNNKATKGGAVYLMDSPLINADDSEVKGQVKINLTIQNTDTAAYNDCSFSGNIATENGGAVCSAPTADNTVTVKTSNVSFSNNTAANGGALSLTGATKLSECKNSSFEGNTATGNGGAIYTERAITTIDGTTFKDNSAKSGAAIYTRLFYATDTSRSTVTTNITGSSFEGNVSTSVGGAIFTSTKQTTAEGATKELEHILNLKITDSDFTGNKGSNGGAIYATNTTRMTLTNAEFDGNTAGKGGAISTINSGCYVVAEDSVFKNNSAETGGAIYLNWGSVSSFDGCEFTENHATAGNGGAIRGEGNTDFYVLNIGATKACTFTGNTASSVGGAILAGSTSGHKPKTNIYNATFTQNEAGAAGAAVGITGASVTTMTDCTLTNNTDKEGFGAIYLQNDNAALTLSGKMIVKDNANKNTAQANLYMRGDGERIPHVSFTNLAADAWIGISASDQRYNLDPILSVGDVTKAEGDFDLNDCFFSASENRFLVCVTPEGLKLVQYIDEAGNGYSSLNEAVAAAMAAGKEKFVVERSNNLDKTPVEITKNFAIDLNGFDVTQINVADDATLSLMDSKTADYDVADGDYGKAKVNGNVEAIYTFNEGGNRRYVAIDHGNNVYSAHRVYMAINTKVLRTANDGLGFKAIFAGDQVVESKLDGFGIELCKSEFGKDEAYRDAENIPDGIVSAVFATENFESGTPAGKTPNQVCAVATGVLKQSNTLAKNQENFASALNGRPYFEIDGVRYYGAVVTTSMKAITEKHPDDTHVQNFLNKFFPQQSAQ